MRTVNIYDDVADLVFSFVAAIPDIYLAFDLECIAIDLLEPAEDELFRFEVVFDDGVGEDVLLIAEGIVTHEFNLELEVLDTE